MEKVYSRPESLDISNNKFCPGCMHSTFIKICMQVIDELGIGDRAVVIQPIGVPTIVPRVLPLTRAAPFMAVPRHMPPD